MSRQLEKGHLTVLNQLTDDHNLMYCFTFEEKMKKKFLLIDKNMGVFERRIVFFFLDFFLNFIFLLFFFH